MYGSSRLGLWRWDTIVPAAPPIAGDNSPIQDSLMIGSRNYELTNHLGNVFATISDKKIGHDSSGVANYYIAEVLSQNDYYPFGMQMPGRKYNATNGYRYGFNGKENDNEVKGEGEQQDYGMRIYDPRIGRFLSIDPLSRKYPWYSPFQFAGNKPTRYKDIDGAEEEGEEGVEEERDELGEALSRIREAREELEREESAKLREFAGKVNAPKLSSLLPNYWANAFRSASFVLTGGGDVKDNKKLGDAWEGLVREEMLKNPDCIGVARQVSLKVTGMVNGEQVVAKIRIDNVGVNKSSDGKISFDLSEAKFSFEQITVNNILRTLTPEQLKASNIIINGTNVQILIRGAGGAKKIQSIIETVDAGSSKDPLKNGSDISGSIREINVVVNQSNKTSNSSAARSATTQPVKTNSTNTNTTKKKG